MKDKRFWGLVLLLGCLAGAISFRNGFSARSTRSAETRKTTKASVPATNGSCLLSVVAARARQGSPAVGASSHDVFRSARETTGVFREFSAWATSFLAGSPDERGSQPIEEGIRLAKERRDTLARVIRVNPRLAIEMAAPRHWRKELPPAIASLLEEQPSARGNLEVYCALPLPGTDHHASEGGTIRYVTFGEQSYRAYVYGRRVRQMTRHDVALHGVAVDGVMAVAEEPLRLMEAGESKAAIQANAGDVETCAVCGVKSSATQADHGGHAVSFCSAAHAAEMSRTLAAAEDAAPLAAALESPGNTPPPVSPAGTFGPKKVLYIRVVFADDATVPIEAAEAAAAMDEVNHFYVESSYNKTALVSSITPLVTLAQGKLYYAAQGPGALARDARAGALAAGFEAGNYDLVLIRHTNVPGFTWGGLGGGGTAWLQTSSAGVIAHELGHNYGLPHANYWDTRRDTLPADPNTFPFDVDSLVGRDTVIGPGDDVSYGDVHDVMGGGGGESNPPAGETNVISALNGHFNPVGKSLLGWLPDAYVLPADQGAATRLYVHDTASLVAGRVYAVTARKDEQRTYWVSARSRFPNDPTLQNGVELHWGPWQQSLGYSHLLDTTPGTKVAQGDASLLLGRTFSDRASDIHITPVAKGGAGVETWFDLVVNTGPFSNNVPPDVQFTFSTEETITGSNVTFTAKATDANGDRIAHFWDFGDGTFGLNAATVTKAWTNQGDYVVRCEVSDLKGGVTVKHTVVRVGFPTTLRISGRVIDTFGQPVAGARVSNGSLTNNTDLADDYSWTYTDSDGAYTLVNLAPNTMYPIGIYLDGYVTEPLNFVTPVTLTDRDAVNANFEAQPLPRVSVTTGRDASKAPAASGFFQLTRTGDLSVPLRALFVLGGTAGTNDYKAYTNVVQQTNSNPNPFGVITNLITFQYIDFAPGAATTNLTITPSTNAASGEDKYLSLTIMYALQAQRVTMATNTNTVNFTGWVITPVNGRDTWFQTDPDYIPGAPAEAKLYIRGPVASLPTVSVVASDATATENRNDAGMFLVTRFGRLDQAVTVTLESGGTAVAGSDYDPLPLSVTIPAGQTTLRVPVLVRPNQFLDGNKTVDLTVRANPAYQVGAAKATVTIVDNDLAQLTITALDAAIPGRDTARGTFQVTRTGDLTRELVVNYLVTGSAISGDDYRALPGSVTLAAGQPSATITVTPRNSTRPKGERVLTILLADSPVYNSGFPNEASMVIQDATLSFVTVSTSLDRLSEGTVGLFLLHREGDLSRGITVHFSLGGTATPLVDYAGVGDRVTFPPFINEMPIMVSLTGDGLLEDPAETVSLRIEPGSGYNVSSPNQATFTITDNDSGQPAVGFAQLTSSGPEGSGTNFVTVAVTGNPAEGANVTVDYKIIGGTAKAGLDYPTNVSTGRLVFIHATNATPETAFLLRSLQIPIPFLDNSNAQPNRTIVIGLFEPAPTVTNEVVTNMVTDPMNPAVTQTNVVTNIVVIPVPMNATFDTYKSHTLTILDDDASVVSVSATEPVAAEEASQVGSFTIRRSNPKGAQKVYFQLSGSATPGSDYQAPESPIEIPNGIDAITIPIVPVDDPVQEYLEAVTLTLLSAPGAQLGSDRSATVNIRDNDGTVEFTATAYSTVENTGVALIPIRRTGNTSSPASVEYTFTGGSAVAGVDYVATNGIVTFAAGETSSQVPVIILDDSMVEPPKTLGLLLRNAGDRSPLGGQSTAVVTILDDDTAVEFAQSVFRTPENATNALITVRRIGVATNAFKVDYLVNQTGLTNGVATEAVDYAPTNGTLNFGPGQTEATFQVRLLNDALLEGDEMARLILTNATGGAVLGAQASADLVIVDDECQIEFALPDNRVPEYAGTASVVVRRIGGTVLPATVAFATKSGTAKAGRDFVSVAGTVSFSGDSFVLPVNGSGVPVFVPGESEKTIQVRILDNAVGEGDRQFTLDLSNPRGPTGTLANSITLGTGTNTLVTIADDETPGQVDFHYNPGVGTDRRVHTVAVQTDGKTLLGGEFTTVDGIVFNRLARLHDDGYLDSSLNPGAGASDTVFAIAAQPDGRILAGGDFLQINGAFRGRVARLNGDGTVDETFDPGSGADERVRAITIQTDGAILVGGEFATVNDESRSGVARLNSDGSLDQTFDPGTGASGGAVRSLALQVDGKILVGGSFVAFGGGTRSYLVRLNAAGTVDNSFAATGTPNGAVWAIAVQADGKIVIGGEFTTVGGQSRKGIARLLPDGALDTGFDPGAGANATVFAVGVQTDGKILAGGAFTNFNDMPLNRLARLNPEGSVDDGFDIGSGANGTVRALVLQPDGAIVIGGDFTIVRDLPRSHIARVHGDDKFTLNKLQFAAASYRIAEDQGLATITVRRSGDTTGATTVGYETADASALAGINYLPAQGVLQFAPGETQQSFAVKVLNDGVARGDTTVKLLLTNIPSGFSLSARLSAILTIEGVEGAVNFTASDYTVSESEGVARIGVNLTRPSSVPVTVAYATLNDSATNGIDYLSGGGDLVFASGETNQTILVSIINENLPRPDRSLRLQLYNPRGGAALGQPSLATLTIADDDRGPSFRVAIASVAGGTVTPASGSFPAGTVKSFTATPARDFQFVRWEGSTNSTLNPLTLVLNRDYSLTPVFRPQAYTYNFAPPFSANDLAKSPWRTFGDSPWQIVPPAEAESGDYALRSGDIGDSQQSGLELTAITREGSGSFDVRVSSEEAWDFLEFYLNDTLQHRWSGDVPWESFQFQVSAGENRFSWRYAKDGNFRSRLDAAFISNLYLPVAGSGSNLPPATLRAFLTATGSTRLQLQGQPGYEYTVEASNDLVHWQVIATSQLSGSTTVSVIDPDAGKFPQRFYRAITH